MFDCFWYTPENRDKALAQLVRLSADECSRRRTPYGLRFWFDLVPLPDADGKRVAGYGTFVVRNFFGSSALRPGRVNGDTTLPVCEFVRPCVLAEGLVGGCLREEPERFPELAKAAEAERANEARVEEEFQKSGGFLAVKTRAALFRWIGAMYVLENCVAAETDELRDDAALLAKLTAARRRARKPWRRVLNFIRRVPPLPPLQTEFACGIFPELISGEPLRFTPARADDPADKVEAHYRRAYNQLRVP